ncbi:hypothetical protein AOQ84DRAFT_303776 [Glonium stellatum]|uniref:Chromo domain-containing protein n=1 Tax=Glonium stellatum TaxID=574774 RepID=A0A8E2EQT1_9PEZI|nr:hypothetical protein AOQ84DRAFT_303776 [Glonium stellatum]
MIKKAFGSQAYELDLPSRWKIHPVISVEQLEPAPPDHDPFDRPIDDHPAAIFTDEPQYRVERLLDRRARRYGRSKEKTQYLVKWLGYGQEENTWVNEEDIHEDLIKEYRYTH